MCWPSLRTQPGHVVKTKTCPSSAWCLVMEPPIPRGPATSQPLGESPRVTIYEGEARREDRAGDWVKVPFEAQRKVVRRRLDQSWKTLVDVSTTVPRPTVGTGASHKPHYHAVSWKGQWTSSQTWV